jgi:hypothetical protein
MESEQCNKLEKEYRNLHMRLELPGKGWKCRRNVDSKNGKKGEI